MKAMPLIAVYLTALLCSPNISAEIYKWVDDDGKVHFGEKNTSGSTNGESVKVNDKYSVTRVTKKQPIPYSNGSPSRTLVLSEVTLDIPEANLRNVLMGRVVCGNPVDIFWTQGDLKFDRHEIGIQFVKTMEENGYMARIGDPVREEGELEVVAKFKKVFINRCVKDASRKLSQNSTYLNIEWTLIDPLATEEGKTFNSKGSHHGIDAPAVVNGQAISFDSALDVAVKNLLSDQFFVDEVGSMDDVTISEKELESNSLSLNLSYAGKLGSFKKNVESLKERTVVVKTTGGHGSGVVIAKGGYVLTNAHVVGDENSVTIGIGSKSLRAELVKKNEARDVALLKIEPSSSLSSVEISQERVSEGDQLYVIGTPLDVSLSHTVTSGVMSAERRMRGMKFIQTDAAINPGNSGGPVFNNKGHLVAIAVSSLMTREGASLNINYLIPIDDALKRLNIKDISNVNSASTFVRGMVEPGGSVDTQNKSVYESIFDWLDTPVFQLL
ncbi:trypsin-like peptidase domain-containing protein [Teredinibacter sp. KSP-S5-2]|uniref:trypsin-like peptidase domain-containing protein n=1 Tax=Teredinibacter sp. KSP-S5-2 TaxID=3034506 RepID=UPI0029349012|nr:trypsin-like peptidase domain-containing protein [Teredinibacter sp. KSP-S5-2]WNO11309.1 trypsin-like peptidase domain-containing protein [Teredinibacter sp. KSP-S5-2]